MTTKVNLTLILLLLLAPVSLFAQFNQWIPENGVPIRTAPNVEFSGGMDTNENQQTLITWSEFSGISRDLYAMLLDENGLELWDDPLVICDQPGSQDLSSVLALPDNEWIVAWADYRDDNTSNYHEYYLQKVNSAGEIFFAGDGLQVSFSSRNKIVPLQLASDGSNGCIVSWAHRIGTEFQFLLQRVTNDGTFSWDQNGLMLAEGNCMLWDWDREVVWSLIPDGNGGAIIAYPDEDMGNLYITRINQDGEFVWGSEENEYRYVLSDPQRYICDLDMDLRNGSIFVTWNYYIYNENAGEVFVQKLNFDGEIQWSEFGEIIETEENPSQYFPRIKALNESEAVVFYQNAYFNDERTDIFMQKVSGDDSMVRNWGNGSSVALTEDISNEYDLDICFDGNGGLYVTWTYQDVSITDESTIFGEHIDNDGQHLWSDINQNDLAVTLSSGRQPAVKMLENGRAFFVWQGITENGSGIQTQIVNNDASLQFPQSAFEINMKLNGGTGYTQSVQSGDNYFICWIDSRQMIGQAENRLFIQMMNEQSETAFAQNGIPLSTTPNVYPHSYKMIPDNMGGVYVVWAYHDEGRIDGYLMQHVDQNGNLLCGDTALSMDDVLSNDILNFELFALENSDFLIFYSTRDQNQVPRIYCQRIDSNHQTVWENPLEFNHPTYGYRITIQDIIDLDGEIFVLNSMDVQNSRSYFLLDKLNLDGEMLWADPVMILNDYTYYYEPKLNIMENNLLLTWKSNNNVSPKFVNACPISPEGELVWHDGNRVLFQSEEVSGYRIGIEDNQSSTFWMSWAEKEQTGPLWQIRVQRFDSEGNPTIDDFGVPVTDAFRKLRNGSIHVLSDNSAFFIWTEGTDYSNEDIKFTHLGPDGIVVNSGTPYPINNALLAGNFNAQSSENTFKYSDSGFISIFSDERNKWEDKTFRGIYAQRVDDGFTAVNGQNVATNPDAFEISKTWPNPFNPSINISFKVVNSSNVKLTVFDILGREVAVLLNEKLQAGQHTINWNGFNSSGNLATSGTYFIQMQTPEFKQVKKITLLK